MRRHTLSVDVDVIMDEFADYELIDELEARGYTVLGETDDPLFKLRQSYLLDSPEDFHKFIERMFRERGMPL